MQGATLSDYYCEHDIAGDAVPGRATSFTWFFEVSRDSQEVFTLETAFAWTDLASRGLDRVQAIGEVGQEGLHRVKGRLSLGWFEAGKRYEHTIAGGAERVDPPFPEPECSRFASDEERAEYWLLRSLHHIRTEYPEAFKNVSFDWRGVCIVAQVPIRAGRVALDLLTEKGLISGVRYDPTTQAGQFEPVGYMYISAGGVDYYRGLEQAIRSQMIVSPKWQTKQTSEEIQERVPAVINAIESWIPKQRYSTEEAYEAALAEYLSGQGIEAPEQQGMSLTDILAAHGIGIEVKLRPGRSDYDRLSGQIIRQLEEFGVVVVLIVRPDKRDLLEEYKVRFDYDSRVTFITK